MEIKKIKNPRRKHLAYRNHCMELWRNMIIVNRIHDGEGLETSFVLDIDEPAKF